jgi:sodium-dependent dicarboxylate transporter 2/3/5
MQLRDTSAQRRWPLILSALLLVLALLNRQLAWGLLSMGPVAFSQLMLFTSCLVLWLFVSLDWPSLLCLLVLGIMPEMGFKLACQQSFGNSTFVFLTFTFTLSYALEQTPALRRLTARALEAPWVQQKPWRFILSYLSVLLFMALFMSPTVLFMIIFPIYEAVCQAFGWEKGERSPGILLFASYSCLAIGTAMTPINHVFAVTALGIYKEATGKAITYGQYMRLGLPLGLLLFVILLLSVRFLWRLDLSRAKISELELGTDLPPVTAQERHIVRIFLLVVALWLLPELLSPLWPALGTFFSRMGNVFPPLLGLILLALIRVEGEPLAKLPELFRKGVFWPSLLLVGAALALGYALTLPDVGLMAFVQESLGAGLGRLAPYLLVLVFAAWTGIQTNFSSNLVSVTVVGSMAVTLLAGQPEASLAPTVLCLVGFMASLAFMTPPAMPYVGISLGSGWLSSRQAFTYGLWLLAWAIALSVLVAYPLGQLVF